LDVIVVGAVTLVVRVVIGPRNGLGAGAIDVEDVGVDVATGSTVGTAAGGDGGGAYVSVTGVVAEAAPKADPLGD
jgi:hypothetical protein